MSDFMDKVVNFGFGAYAVTKERAQSLIDEMIEKGQISKEERSKAVDDLMQKAQEERTEFNQRIEDNIKQVMQRLDLATRDDIRELHKKLDQLLQKQ